MHLWCLKEIGKDNTVFSSISINYDEAYNRRKKVIFRHLFMVKFYGCHQFVNFCNLQQKRFDICNFHA